MTKQDLDDQMCVILGGRTSEEIFFGEVFMILYLGHKWSSRWSAESEKTGKGNAGNLWDERPAS